ncbi:alpha/beta hydrolase [Gordonia paraffinivorans]|uniref:alpha/beta hydrolase n=1 Tax=Gordonia paraffinivorans TaxID=175628 RepID=UPI001445E08A|nr:alpha/beta hydrolase [Gordonia paraffinivorans]MCD2144317.1 alpha/beta hydrolase [Gordonia paraffinivorans]
MRRARAVKASLPGALMGAIVAMVVSSCAVGPDPGPDLVPGGGKGAGSVPSSSAPDPAPTLTAPATDLEWTECAGTTAQRYGVGRPADVTIECADYRSPIDRDKPDGEALTIAVTRARTAETPADAAPLVLTSGSDMPSSRTLMVLASGRGRAILDTHPVVAVDHRGIPLSGDVDCMTREERATIVSNGLAPRGASTQARISRLASAASSASDGCTETLTPYQLNFSAGFAASDLETLRSRWGVEHLGLIGVGEGSDVVLAYASLYGGRAGRIILDTPTPFGANARDRAQLRAQGVQTALQGFAQRCSTLDGCPLGTNGVGVMNSVLTKARAGRLDGLSDTSALNAITTTLALAPDRPDALLDLARAISAADSGNTAALVRLAERADALRLPDGAIVSRCNDVTGPVGQNEVPGLVDAWSKQSSLTGSDSALSLVRCNGWAAGTAVRAPSSLPADPLVLNGTRDPINGGLGANALAPVFLNASAEPVTVSWDGLGYSVLARSDCAAGVVAEYVAKAPLGGPTQRGCPA